MLLHEKREIHRLLFNMFLRHMFMKHVYERRVCVLLASADYDSANKINFHYTIRCNLIPIAWE